MRTRGPPEPGMDPWRRPRRPERAYMDILKPITRTVRRSVSRLEIDDDVLGREPELGSLPHALSFMPALAL